MRFRIEIRNVQQIERLDFELDLTENKLTCLVGRNGVGKTTVVRALRNLSQADTFVNTAPPGIFVDESSISYSVNGKKVAFEYDKEIMGLNCKQEIPETHKGLCAVELPIPHGDRFKFFQSISRIDRDIRRMIILGEYSRPEELIGFLSEIYSSKKFQSLIEMEIRGNRYYGILSKDGTYVREDYFSSGEYFLVSLYRMVTGSARLIVVDEIDISLDAAAQVHLIQRLRGFCGKYQCSILFTTHSLAMMRTLKGQELLFLEQAERGTVLKPVSYSYVRSRLFGFLGFDRYILTEDRVLRDFLESFIRRYCPNVFFEYKIIYIGGASQVADLLVRNRDDHFLSDPMNIIAVLDGDKREEDFAQENNVYCLPFDNVEAALYQYYIEDDFPYRLSEGKGFNGPKDLFNSLRRDRIMSTETINHYLCDRMEGELEELASVLRQFLSQK